MIDKLTAAETRLLEIFADNERGDSNKKDCLHLIIKGLVTDSLNLFKNITETSLMQDDFDLRVNEMCNSYGISYQLEKFH